MSDARPRIPGDARTRCFTPSYEHDQEAISLGQELAQAFSNLYSNVGSVADLELWRRADDAIADLLEELWKRTPDDRAELLAQAVQHAFSQNGTGNEPLRRALAIYRGEL